VGDVERGHFLGAGVAKVCLHQFDILELLKTVEAPI
jgi:hypothetical protein